MTINTEWQKKEFIGQHLTILLNFSVFNNIKMKPLSQFILVRLSTKCFDSLLLESGNYCIRLLLFSLLWNIKQFLEQYKVIQQK